MRRRNLIVGLILVAILFSYGGIASAATPGYRQSHGVGDILGQAKNQSDAHKIFRMVRYVQASFAGAATLAADSIVVWNLTEDDGVTVTTTTVSSDSAVAGIIVTQALTQDTENNTAVQDRGRDNWTWLQTYGLSQVDNLLIINNAGDAMGTSTTAGEATSHLGSVTDPRAQGVAGFFYDTSAAAQTDVECFLTLD